MTERPIGIVAPLYSPFVGGVERYVERLAAGLRARGMPVEIVSTDPSSRAPTRDVVEGIIVRRFPTLRGDRTFFASPSLTRWLSSNAHRYALLHAHNLHTLVPLAAAAAARRAGIPLILTAYYHGGGHTPMRRLLHLPYRPFASLVARQAERVVCLSAAECDLLGRHFGSLRTTVVPAGMDRLLLAPPGAAASPGGEARFVTVLSVGRLEAYKSVDRAVRSLAHLPADHRLVVVGDGPARQDIVSAAEESSLTDRVVLRGRVPDDELRHWYGSADVAISLSSHESFGLTVLEAAAAGLPVVASDIPALREVSRFAPAGRVVLVPLDASDAELAAAIRTAVSRGRVAPVGEAQSPGWSLPTWDGLVEGVLAIYAGALSRRAPTPRHDRPG